MTLLQLLKECQSKDIMLSAEADKLIIQARNGEVEPRLRQALKAAQADLLPLVAKGGGSNRHQGTSRAKETPMPLSPYQMPFWGAYSDDAPGGAMRNIAEAFDFEKSIDPQRLQQAIEWTVNRHDMLRTTFAPDVSGTVWQTVNEHPSVPPTVCTPASKMQGGISGIRHSQAVRDMVADFTSKPYDLEREPPLRVGLVNAPSGGSTVVLGMPHVAGDAASLEVVLRDLSSFLNHIEKGLSLPEALPMQYGDFLRWWETNAESSANAEVQLRFWRDSLRDLPPVHGLPTDHIRPTDREKGSFDFTMFVLPFDDGIREFLQTKGISPFVYLHTAMRILLYRFSGIERIPVISPMANRHQMPGAETAVGCFANEVALNIPLNASARIDDALWQTRKYLAQALDYQGTPFGDVIRDLCDQRSQDWLPISQIFFSHLGLAADLPFKHRFDHAEGLAYDLAFITADCKDQVKLMIGYDKALFSDETIQRMGDLFSRICSAIHKNGATTPTNLRLEKAGVSDKKTGHYPGLAPILGITPDSTVVFFDDESAAVLSSIRKAAEEFGASTTVCSPDEPIERTSETLLVTTRAPHQLQPLLRGLASDKLRLCLVNNLPAAPALKEISRALPDGLLLLELPRQSGTTAYASAPFDVCRAIRCNEQYISCTVDPTLFTSAPGKRIDLGSGLQAQSAGPGKMRIPLPGHGTGHIWHEGLPLDLDLLGNSLSKASGGIPVALSFAPSPLAGDRQGKLTAWFVPDSGNMRPLARLADIDGRLPGNWPDYQVAVSAIPLSDSGWVDRQSLGLLPLLSEDILPAIEDDLHAEKFQAALRLASGTTSPSSMHYSREIPKTEQLWIEGRYSALGLNTTTTDTSAIKESVAYGPPLHLEMNISFREHMERFKDNELVFINIDGEKTRHTGQEFLEMAKSLLRAMQRHGLKAGDRAIIYCAEERELYALAWACLLGGICMTGLIPPVAGQSPEALHTRLGHIHTILEKPLVITTSDESMPLENAEIRYFDDLLEEGEALDGPPVYHETRKDTLVYTAFTSGSTGAPKAAPLTAGNVFSMIYAKIQTIGSIENETSFSMTALDHVASLFCNSIYSTVCGARQVYCSFQYILAEPERILDVIHQYRVSQTWAPDFTWRQLYESLKSNKDSHKSWDLSCIRHIISAAENTREATFRNLEQALKPYGMPSRVLLHSWGMSETSSLLTMSDYWDGESHIAYKGIIDAGRPMAGSAFRIADRNGTPLPEGDIGSFQVNGPSVLGEYYNNPKANAESFTRDGWFISGDLAMIRDDKVIFCGREKEQVVIKGQNIAQFDIEGFVDGIEGVEPTFSVVIGCKNEKTNDDDILVFVHTKRSAPEERALIIRNINSALAAQFGVVPAQVLLVEESDVPKALLGKIQRTNILKRFLKGEFSDQVRETDMLLGNHRTLPNWFASREWTRANLPEGTPFAPESPRENPIVLTGTNKVLLEIIAKRLGDSGTAVETVSPEVAKTRLGNDNENGPSLLYLLEEEPGQTNGPEHAAWVKDSLCPLYGLMSSLAEREGTGATLIIVTINGQAVHRSSSVSPWTSAVSGLAASLSRHTGALVRLVDIDDASAENAASILREIAAPQEPLSAWRSGQRWVPMLRPWDKGVKTISDDWILPFRNDRFCLCTGMTGRVGKEMLPELLRVTEGNFLLTGRRPAAEVLPILEETCGSIPDWTRRVHYAPARLDDAETLQAALKEGARYFTGINAGPIVPGGVLHLAADTGERGFRDVTEKEMSSGMQQRITHLQNLERAFVNSGGSGPRIAFSSVLSLWGGVDSALYAPASALAEAFVHNQAAKSPASEAWHCFMWSRWLDPAQENDIIARLMEERGFLTIDAARGTLSLLTMMHRSVNGEGGTLLAGINTQSPHISRYMQKPGHTVHPQKALDVFSPAGVRTDGLRSFLRQRLGRRVPIRMRELANPEYDKQGHLILSNTDQTEPLAASPVEKRMTHIWSSVLRLPHVAPDASFFELGGTSVLVPRLRKLILEEFDVDLGSVGIFDYPSIREMAKAVQKDPEDETEARAAMAVASSRAQRQKAARRAKR